MNDQSDYGNEHSLLKEQYNSDILELIKYLNSIEEITNDPRILLPREMESLQWNSFQSSFNLADRAIRSIKRSIKLLTPKSRRHQIFCYYEILCFDVIVQTKSIKKALSILFELKIWNIHSYIKAFKLFLGSCSKEHQIGRYPVLSYNQIQELTEEISSKVQNYHPMSKSDICQYIETQFSKTVSKKTVSRLIKQENKLVFCDAYPLDDERTEVTIEEIRQYFIQLKEAVEDVDPELILNVDEIGFSRRTNGKKKKYVACKSDLNERKNNKIFYEKETDLTKTFSLIAGISLSGDYTKPMMIVPVQSCPITFLTNDVWIGKDCVFAYSESGFNNSRIFEMWFEKILIPHMQKEEHRKFLCLCQIFQEGIRCCNMKCS